MASSSTQPVPRRRSWRFRIVRAGVVAALIVVVGVVTVTQTPVLRWIVMGQIEGRLGGEASAGSCRISLGGELVVRDLVLRLPGLEGEAGEYLRAAELRAQIDWGSLLGPGNPLTELELSESLLRVSLEEESSAVNLSLLRPRAGSGVSSGYPRIALRDVTIELGEHRLAVGGAAAQYTRLTTLDLQGQMIERVGVDGLYEIELSQMMGDGSTLGGARVEGAIDRESGEVLLTLTGLDLAEWSSRTAPSRIREFWRAMDVRGAIDDATFTYGPEEGLAVRLTPRDVDLLVPITVADEQERTGSRREMLQMRDVRGTILFAQSGFTADLAGEIEELACRVTMQYDSYSFDSSYRAQIETDSFSFDDEGQLQRFAPPLMLRVMDRFVEPQADLSGFVRVSRGRSADGSPGRTITEGILNITNGSGRFGEYPYPIENISGRVQFDENEVRLVDIRGESATGARLQASGRIWPPRDGAAVEIGIVLRDLKTDELFLESLPENRRAVYRTIFNELEYDALREAGEVLSSADRESLVRERIDLQSRLDEMEGDDRASPVERETAMGRLGTIDERLAMPVFDLGGTGTLDIQILREEGEDSSYTEVITVDIPDAGMVVDRFPYPAIAERLRIVISEGLATIEPTPLRGLHGGGGTIEGEVRYSMSDYSPAIRIRAADVPLDSLLIRALPGREVFEERAAAAEISSVFSVHRFLRRLNLVGTASCEAEIFESGDGGTGFRVDVEFAEVSAHPADTAVMSDAELLRMDVCSASVAPALLTELSGALTVTDERLDLHRLVGLVSGEAGSPFEGTAAVRFADGSLGGAESLDVRLRASGIDIGQPVERVLDAADASRASVVAGLRERFRPGGRLDASLSLLGEGDAIRYEIEADGIERVEFDAFGGRMSVVRPDGSIRVVPGRVELAGISGQLRFDGALAGQLAVEGAYGLDAIGAEAGESLALRGSVRDALFESAMPGAVIGRFSPALGERVQELGLAGLFDADFAVFSGETDGLEAEVRPRTLTVVREGRTASFDRASGAIGVSDDGGPIDLELTSQELSVSIQGAWERSNEGVFSLDANIDGTASGFHDAVRAVLPETVCTISDAMEIASDQPVSLTGGRLRVDADRVRFDGVAGFESLSMRAGLKLDGMLGRANIRADLVGDDAPEVEVDVSGERATAAGAQLSELSARIETGAAFVGDHPERADDAPGTVYVPGVSASVAGGRLAAQAVLRPDGESGTLAGGPWQVDADLSGVEFGRLLGELARDPQRAAKAVENRGVLDGSFTLEGRLGDTATQRGRAMLRVQAAEGEGETQVLRLPGLIEFVKLSNLQAPVSEPIDFAYAEAFIEGRVVHLHDLSAESESVSIKGSGTMTMPELNLNLTFTTVVLRDVSLLAEIFERVRNELVTARITGTLYDPQVEVEQLTATRKLIDAMIRGEEPSPRP